MIEATSTKPKNTRLVRNGEIDISKVIIIKPTKRLKIIVKFHPQRIHNMKSEH